jgi:cobalt-precorrin-5B (C1)-methyltransferase
MAKKLRTGFTTGTAAAAATRGALTMIFESKAPSSVPIKLLTGDTLDIKVHTCVLDTKVQATCTVIKDAGDDPDVTHKAEIGATVKLGNMDSGIAIENPQPQLIRITGGKGVGRVTKPGLEVPPGEPAINPGPRKMISQAVIDVFEKHQTQYPLQVEIFVPDGEKLAEKTLNARLGILGGISILGTTGIVRPMSHDAFIATIQSAASVARASGLDHVVFTTGRRSERFAQAYWPNMPEDAFIQIGDFFKMSLECASKLNFKRISLAVFFGKATKMAQGIPHTHAAKARLTMEKLSEWGYELTHDDDFSKRIMEANTARHAFDIIGQQYPEVIFIVGKKIVSCAETFLSKPIKVDAVIFDYNGSVVFDSTNQEKLQGIER